MAIGFGLFCIALLFGSALAQQACGPVGTLLSVVPMCTPYVTSPLVTLLPGNQSQLLASVAFAQLRNLAHLSQAHTGASRNCVDIAARLICGNLFPPCEVLSLGGSSVVASSPPCVSSCTALFTTPAQLPNLFGGAIAVNGNVTIQNATCYESLIYGHNAGAEQLIPRYTNYTTPAFLAQLEPPCNSATYGDQVYTANGVSGTVTCSNLPLVPQTTATIPCYDPFQENTHATPYDSYCEFVCPFQISWNQRYQASMVFILAFILTIVSAFTFIWRLTVSKYCLYPANLVAFLIFGVFLYNVLLGTGIWVGTENVACWLGMSQPSVNTRTNLCAAMAVLLFWGYLMWFMAWTMIAVHSAITVILKRSVFNRYSMFGCYAALIFLPPFLTAICMYNGQIGQYSSQSYCWAANAAGSANRVWALFWAPICLCALISLISISIVIVAMLRVGDPTSPWHVQNNIRLILFLLLGEVACLLFFAFRIYGNFINASFQANYPFWIQCSILRNGCNRDDFFSNDGAKSFQPAYLALNHLLPMCICILFLCNKELWTGWSERIWPWRGLLLFVSTPGESSATSTTAGSSSGSSGSSGTDEGTFVSDLQ
jgi:hypothetical protein